MTLTLGAWYKAPQDTVAAQVLAQLPDGYVVVWHPPDAKDQHQGYPGWTDTWSTDHQAKVVQVARYVVPVHVVAGPDGTPQVTLQLADGQVALGTGHAEVCVPLAPARGPEGDTPSVPPSAKL